MSDADILRTFFTDMIKEKLQDRDRIISLQGDLIKQLTKQQKQLVATLQSYQQASRVPSQATEGGAG